MNLMNAQSPEKEEKKPRQFCANDKLNRIIEEAHKDCRDFWFEGSEEKLDEALGDFGYDFLFGVLERLGIYDSDVDEKIDRIFENAKLTLE